MGKTLVDQSQVTNASSSKLYCRKCGDETIMSTSSATGKNELLRNCDSCTATDKWLCRSCNPTPRKLKRMAPGEEPELSDHQKEMQKAARQVKDELSKMSPEQKKAWYLKEKAKRKEESTSQRRTFDQPKGVIEQGSQLENKMHDVDEWENFEDWAVRQITLGRCTDEETAKPLWIKACADPNNIVTEKRGQKFLGRHKGLEHKAGETQFCRQGLKQSMELDGIEALGDFEGQAHLTGTRFLARASKAHENAASASDPKVSEVGRLMNDAELNPRNTSSHHTVKAEIERQAEQAAQLDAELAEQAIHAAQARDLRMAECRAQRNKPKFVSIEKASTNSLLAKIQQSLDDDQIKHLQRETESTNDINTLLKQNPGPLKDMVEDAKEQKRLIDTAIAAYSDNVRDEKARLQTLVEDQPESATGEDFVKLRVKLAEDLKTLFAKNAALQNVQKANQVYKAFKDQCSGIVKRLEAEEAKAAAKRSAVGGPASVVISNLAKELKDHVKAKQDKKEEIKNINIGWALHDALVANANPKIVLYPLARVGTFATDLKAMDYYNKQKEWVQKIMKESRLSHASVAVSKAGVRKTILKMINKLDSDAACFVHQVKAAADVTAPQFYQMTDVRIQLATDFALTEARVVTEGGEIVFAVSRDHIPGDNLGAKAELLSKLSGAQFLEYVEKHGSIVKVDVGDAVFIPGDVAFATVPTSGASLGLRWLFAGSKEEQQISTTFISICTDLQYDHAMGEHIKEVIAQNNSD